MKIGIVTDQLLAGGVQLAAIEQVKELNRLGHKAKLLILMRKKYPIDFSYLVKDVPHEYLSDSYPELFQRTVKLPIFSFLSTLHLMSPLLAPRVIKNNDYDILISLGTTTCLTTQAIFRKLKIPYIAVIHDPIVYILEKTYSNTFLKYFFPILKPIARYFERSFVKDARKTLIISQVHYDYIKNNYNVRPQMLGFGTKTLDTIPKQRGDNILSFGRWQKEKNPQFLLDLIKSIPKVKLTIAGHWISNDELKQFASKIKTYNLEKRVSLVPHYENEDLAKLCAKARVFIHPHFEAFGLAALEAAGHGLPIIIPEKSGVTEMFVNETHGFFPSKGNVKEYKKYITKLMNNERLAYKMGYIAWSLVRENYSWESNAKNLLKIIHKSLLISNDKKIRIVVLEAGHASESYLAGGDKVLEKIVKYLPPKYEFKIIVPKIGAKHWRESHLDVDCFILPSSPFDNNMKPTYVFVAYCIRIWQSFWKLKNLEEKDIIYSSTHVISDILPAYFIKKTQGTLWTAKIHHLIPSPLSRPRNPLLVNIVSYLMQKVALFCLRDADLIFTNNALIFEELKKLGFSKTKIRTLGNGLDYKKIASYHYQKMTQKYSAVYVGRIHPTKGVFDLVPIWRYVTHVLAHTKLAVIGEGGEDIKRLLAEEVKKNNLSGKIDILGYIPERELFSILKNAQVFLFTDHEAGWGLAAAEAMACGLPVVGYDLPIFQEVYKSGFITVPQYDTNSFAKQVVALLKNPRLRKKLSDSAKREAKKLSWESTAKKFSEYIEEVT